MSEESKHAFVYERNRPNKDIFKDRMLNLVQVAGILNISKSMVYKLINQGDIKSIRIGRSHRVFESALRDYIEKKYETIS